MGLFNWFFRWVARRAFRRVDADGNGTLEPIEVPRAFEPHKHELAGSRSSFQTRGYCRQWHTCRHAAGAPASECAADENFTFLPVQVEVAVLQVHLLSCALSFTSMTVAC